ncbi:MAG: hypothetical protein SVV67_11290 [Bacillota bacterium]|nr:hypothetical protein [Bacillota bacterium]
MKVENMTSRNGNKIANQFIITDGRFRVFQSYDSAIAKIDLQTGSVTLDERFWDYSVTTGKYRNLFLGETKAETQKKIDSGVYKLVDLNG